MIAHLVLLAAAQSSQSLFGIYDRITPQVAAERVKRCGAGSVTVKSDTEIDADVLVIAVGGSVTDEQLACIDKAASLYDVQLPTSIQPRFDAIRKAYAAAAMAAEGRKWLSDHKLLDRLPDYVPGVTRDSDFAHKIEDLCKARGALSSRYGFHAVNPDWVVKNSRFKSDGPFACLLNATWATGYQLGFIGKEAYAPKR
ncbi:MAG: hypothetical protein ACTHMG_08745 [Sphingomonas sp.]